jgi:hypothetical protein
LENIRPLTETSQRKSLKRLDQAMSVAKTSARMATQLSQLGPQNKTVVFTLKEHDPAARIHFLNWFLQPYAQLLVFLSDEAWFSLRSR